MNFANLICEYLFGTLHIITDTLDILIKTAKDTLLHLEAIARSIMNTIIKSYDILCTTAINMVKEFQKTLIENIPGAKGGDGNIFCWKIFKCMAIIEQLLNKNGWLYNMLNRWFKRQCHDFVNEDLWDEIHGIISDFNRFSSTVCKFGMTFEFGIATMTEGLQYVKRKLVEAYEECEKKLKYFHNWCFKYLNVIIDLGIIDFLEQLMSFFTCIFDDNSRSCAEIATASNYYKNAMSALHLEKNGSGYDLSSEYKNGFFGEMEAMKTRINNITNDVNTLSGKLVNGDMVYKANNAYNLADLISTNMHTYFRKGSDGKWHLKSWRNIGTGLKDHCAIVKYYRKLSNGALAKKLGITEEEAEKINNSIDENWSEENENMVAEQNLTFEDILEETGIPLNYVLEEFNKIIIKKAEHSTDLYLDSLIQLPGAPASLKNASSTQWDEQQLLDNASFDENGEIWVKYKCEMIHVPLPDLVKVPEDIEYDYSIASNTRNPSEKGIVEPYTSNEMISDGENVMSINALSLKIHQEPENEFSKKCKTYKSWLDGLSMNAAGVARHTEAVL